MSASRQDEKADLSDDDLEEARALLRPASGRKDTSSSSRGAIKDVLWRICELAGPMAASNIFGFSLALVAAVAVGQLNDPVILSAVVLAGSVFNVTGNSVIIGLASGLDTIAGQAFGAGNLLMVGESLQRSVLVCWTVAVPVWVLWLNAAPVLLALNQAPEIVVGAQRYLTIVGPSLFLIGVSNNINRYLTAQRVVTPGTICTILTGLLCPVYNWLFIYRLRLGLDGAAWAFLASNFTQTALLIIAQAWREVTLHGTPEQTWPGFTSLAFQKWSQFLALGVPAALQVCAEWWVFELVILMAGSLPNAETAVSVMGITFNITVVAYMLPAAVGGAVNTRIANELGAGRAKSARLYFQVGLALVLCIQAMFGSCMVLLRDHIPRAFTNAADVVALASHALAPVGMCVMGDGINAVLGGVLRGCGRQAWGAALTLIGYWCVGFPAALLLGFKLHLDVWGFWAALAMASWIQVVVVLTFIVRIRWQEEVDRAAALAGVDSTNFKPATTHTDTHPAPPDSKDKSDSRHSPQRRSSSTNAHSSNPPANLVPSLLSIPGRSRSGGHKYTRINSAGHSREPSHHGRSSPTRAHSLNSNSAQVGANGAQGPAQGVGTGTGTSGGVGGFASELLSYVWPGSAGGGGITRENSLQAAFLRHRMSVGSEGSELVSVPSVTFLQQPSEALTTAHSVGDGASKPSRAHSHQN